MAYSFQVCQLFGEVWLSDDRRACALVLYPEKKKTMFQSIWLDITLIFKAVGLSGVKKALKREAVIKKKQPKVRMAYLWFIGVNPSSQRRGVGSQLLKEVLEQAKTEDRPVFLETSVLKNIAWYQRFGFHQYDYLTLDYTLYFLNNL